MTKDELLKYCSDVYDTTPDCPFEDDFITTVLRHSSTRKYLDPFLEGIQFFVIYFTNDKEHGII